MSLENRDRILLAADRVEQDDPMAAKAIREMLKTDDELVEIFIGRLLTRVTEYAGPRGGFASVDLTNDGSCARLSVEYSVRGDQIMFRMDFDLRKAIKVDAGIDYYVRHAIRQLSSELDECDDDKL